VTLATAPELDHLLVDHYFGHLAPLGLTPKIISDSPTTGPYEFVAVWHEPKRPTFTVTLRVIHSINQPLATIIVESMLNQPVVGGLLGSFLIGISSYICAILFIVVALRSTLSWGWPERHQPVNATV
jgi:hypothetical protein